MDIKTLKSLAGIKQDTAAGGSNISCTGTEKQKLARKHNIKPGTPEWFQLWFSLPYMTGEKPVGKGIRTK